MKILSTFPKLRSELAIMSQISHPFILKLIGVSIHQLCFAMELAPLGDLASYLYEQHVITRLELVTRKAYHETILPRMLTYKICLQVQLDIVDEIKNIHESKRKMINLLF